MQNVIPIGSDLNCRCRRFVETGQIGVVLVADVHVENWCALVLVLIAGVENWCKLVLALIAGV